MTLEQYTSRVDELVNLSSQRVIESVLYPAGNALLGAIKKRIQLDGKKTDGSQIGNYSTKPMYATVDQFDKTGPFNPRGKAETGATKSGRDRITTANVGGKKTAIRNVQGFNAEIRQSMYLPQGYKQLRQIQGKPTGFVNLTYRTDLILDYQANLDTNAVLLGFSKESESLKRKGLEEGTKKRKGYGKVFAPTAQEIKDYGDEVREEISSTIISILKGFA